MVRLAASATSPTSVRGRQGKQARDKFRFEDHDQHTLATSQSVMAM
jgi:hypothetical protein